MPIQTNRPLATRIEVRTSVALELMWILHNCGADHVLSGKFATLDRTRIELGPALRSFWDDGVQGFTEMVVLADRSDTLLTLDLGAFFSRMEEAIAKADTPSLLSELPSERAAILKRLERLRADPELRGRYIALLRASWESVRAEWEALGRQAAGTAAADWNRRLASGTGYHELLERPQIWHGRPELDEQADEAAAEGRLVLSPGWFFGEIHVVEMGGTWYLGRSVRPVNDDDIRRQVSATVSGNLKVLADPTRLAILLWLARQPASVTEVAQHFNLSQPTVSAHVQHLRKAGLLEEKSEGRRAKLTASEESLTRLFASAEESLLKQYRR